MASQDSSQPASQPPASQPPDGEAGRIQSIDTRFTAIETEQREQRGILGRIEAALTGGGSPKAPAAPTPGTGSASDSASGGLSVAEQVRRGVQEIEDKKQRDAAAQAAADADKSWRQSIEARLPERRPAEPMTGVKARLQRALFGKQDER